MSIRGSVMLPILQHCEERNGNGLLASKTWLVGIGERTVFALYDIPPINNKAYLYLALHRL